MTITATASTSVGPASSPSRRARGRSHSRRRSTVARAGFASASSSREPTGDLTVERDGSRVVVTAPEFGDGEHPPDARLTVRPVEVGGAGTEVGRVLAEQVMRQRNRGLRNTLAFVDEGVEAVVRRADTHALPRYVRNEADSDADGSNSGTDGATTHRFRFRGQGYELSIECEESAPDARLSP